MEISSSEFAPKPKISIAEKLRKKWEHAFRPASSASEEAFKSIIAVLPPGDMKKSMEMVVPQLKDMLKAQDRSLVFSTIFQRAVTSTVFAGFGAVGGLGVGSLVGAGIGTGILAPIGAITGAITGVGVAFVEPSASQMERSRIAIAAKQQEMMLRTSGGKEAAKVFDATKVDDIVKSIIWGTAAKGGAGGVLSQASNPMA